jgi:hypothetical protein
MAAIYRNANDMSMHLADGVKYRADMMGLPGATQAYFAAEKRWNDWCGDHPTLVAKAKEVQNSLFDWCL